MQPLRCVLDRVDLFLEDDLLGRMLEGLTRKPAPMRQRPVAFAVKDPAVREEKGEQLLALATQVSRTRLSGSNEIADRLMERRPKVASVIQFYAPGDDKLVFVKKLT